MLTLSGERLLAACEQAQCEHALLRPIALLAATLPEYERDRLLNLPMSQRNRLLLQLHRISFGPTLDGYADCPQCGAGMELSLSIGELLESLSDDPTTTWIEWMDAAQPRSLRQVTTADLLASTYLADGALAEEHVLRRCLGMDSSSNQALSDESWQRARAFFDRLHADSELRCALLCPECQHEAMWDVDLGDFIWRKAHHAARRLVVDIHTLAMHYGWRESDIAGMSPARRDAYLELLSA
ncbi:hypothetical protein [Dyella sp. 2HG41-7]|uniref:hypothetical protein n=1 Tax=Dyella sp. 2HG41-7 TaxID=2883239 RepID=UPI001F2FD60A|nr:hypothetical protein [Dyella sp. 2HG41-7]